MTPTAWSDRYIHNMAEKRTHEFQTSIFQTFTVRQNWFVQSSKFRLLSQAIMMTGSDLCSSTKLWQAQEITSQVIYSEFYEQVLLFRKFSEIKAQLFMNIFHGFEAQCVQNVSLYAARCICCIFKPFPDKFLSFLNLKVNLIVMVY